MKFEYIPVLAMLVLSALVPGLFLAVSALFGPRRPSAVKQEPFECGEHQLASPNQRFSIKFYMVAVSFIIFDVEVVFLFPWAVVFKDLGWYGLAVMTPFLAVLAVGLAYEWMRGGLEWE